MVEGFPSSPSIQSFYGTERKQTVVFKHPQTECGTVAPGKTIVSTVITSPKTLALALSLPMVARERDTERHRGRDTERE